ncbi:GPR endopeptidase [Jeotgalibacillus proteolyticus]|uniref:Germination protease n=1 Tax=Jeotgalibacillus proteolyticus TaxID=2082395 RepID=A0A2S5GEQ4_9BACL|nr:GPR endopeptidase [Jeotgalibacillus proteolyticus]PPA71469.1 GPR endopeptidase [Jeotgalibacillus proteolyticus]
MISMRTDLAIEAFETAVEEQLLQEPTIKEEIKVSEDKVDHFTVSKVVVPKSAEQQLGKKEGHYWTLEVPQLRTQNEKWQQSISQALEKVIREFLPLSNISSEAHILVVGLGNWQITPDSLGPLVCENVFITNHLFHNEPEAVEEGFRKVSAIAPGVMGLTGMETSDIIHGIVEKVKPEAVIVIDALAARAVERIHATIQISSTGIQPGAGVGNKRKEISLETLGVPVVSIGIPTVVDAVTITQDTLNYYLKTLGQKKRTQDNPSNSLSVGALPGTKKLTEKDLPTQEERKVYLGMMGELEDHEKRQLLEEVLSPLGHNLIVTPKDTDLFMEQAANIIAMAINSALHESLADGHGTSVTH